MKAAMKTISHPYGRFPDFQAGFQAGFQTDVLADVLESSAILASREILQTIIDHLPSGVTLFNRELKMVVCNAHFKRLLGFPEQLFRDGLPSFAQLALFNAQRGEYGPGDPEVLAAEVVERASHFQPHIFERARPGGTVLEIRGTPLADGGFVSIYTDITERKRAEEELRRLATTDSLTGLINRRCFFEQMTAEMERSDRLGIPLSVLMIDLDHFKAINDRYGHAAGDEALRRFASLCLSSLRPGDGIARMGGEEFAVMLPATPLATAENLAEHLRCQLAGLKINSDNADFQVTTSIGLAQRDGDEPLDSLLHRADRALYAAKTCGRNRCALAHGHDANLEIILRNR